MSFLSGMIGAGASLASRRAFPTSTLNQFRRPGDTPYLDPGQDVMLDDSGQMVSPFSIPPPIDPKILALQKRKVLRSDGGMAPGSAPTAPVSPFPAPPGDVFASLPGAPTQAPPQINYLEGEDLTDADLAAEQSILADTRKPTPATGPAGAVQAAAEVFPQAPYEPGEKQRDIFENEREQWRAGPLDELRPRRPHEPPPDTMGALQENGPVRTAANGGNDEAPRVLASVGGRQYDYTNSSRIPREARIGEGRGNSSQLRIQGNPLAPEPDPALETRLQSHSRRSLLRELDDPYYRATEEYRRRKAIDEEYRTHDKDAATREARALLSEYEADVKAMRAEGGEDIDDRIAQATDALNRELAVLGIRPHVPPKRY